MMLPSNRRAFGSALIGAPLAMSGTHWVRPAVAGEGTHTQPSAWRTWVLDSGNQFRLPPPPNGAATRVELQHLRGLMTSRDGEALRRIAWWHAAAPSYRWNGIAMAEVLRVGLPINIASRHLAVLHTAIADAMVAAWNSKGQYNRPRPSEADPALRPVVASPSSPSYPDEHAVAGAVASTVLAGIFPQRASEFARLAEEVGRARLLAGAAYPSDVTAGAALGRQVGAVALERARRDGSDQPWSGSVPTAPGHWTGTSPAVPQAANWRPWLLSSAAEFRPPPPPGSDSTERAAEMATVRAFQRTPLSNARALFWEAAGGGLRSHEYWNNHLGRLLLESGRGADAPYAARAYALINVAMYDSGVACWDTKYAYWTVRPAQFDPEFRPLFPAPSHPSFPSAHSSFSVAAASVLDHLFPGDTDTLAALAREAGESRIWAGIHYPGDVTAGEAIGRHVADRAIERARADGAEGSALRPRSTGAH